MDMVKKLFPQAFKATEVVSLIIALVIYIVAGAVCGLVIGLLAKIPVIGIIFSLLGAVVGLYGLAGIVLSLLVFFKVVK